MSRGRQNVVRAALALWDTTDRGRRPRKTLTLEAMQVTCLAYRPDGARLVVGLEPWRFSNPGGSGALVILRVTGREMELDRNVRVVEGPVRAVAFHPDGAVLATGYSTGAGSGLLLLDPDGRRGPLGPPLPVDSGRITCLTFDPQGRVLAAGIAGRNTAEVLLWDLDRPLQPRLLGRFSIESEPNHLAFNADGSLLAAGLGSWQRLAGGVALWDVSTQQRRTQGDLRVPEGTVTAVAFCPDSTVLSAGFASMTGQGGLVHWDMPSTRRLVPYPLPEVEGGVKSLTYCADRRTLAVGWSSLLRTTGFLLWDTIPELDRVHRARAVANRDLSQAERVRLLPEIGDPDRS